MRPCCRLAVRRCAKRFAVARTSPRWCRLRFSNAVSRATSCPLNNFPVRTRKRTRPTACIAVGRVLFYAVPRRGNGFIAVWGGASLSFVFLLLFAWSKACLVSKCWGHSGQEGIWAANFYFLRRSVLWETKAFERLSVVAVHRSFVRAQWSIFAGRTSNRCRRSCRPCR